MIKLYSTGCPNCIVLKRMLDNKGIKYEIDNDEQSIIDLGYFCAPLLEVDGKVMLLHEAYDWLKEQGEGN